MSQPLPRGALARGGQRGGRRACSVSLEWDRLGGSVLGSGASMPSSAGDKPTPMPAPAPAHRTEPPNLPHVCGRLAQHIDSAGLFDVGAIGLCTSAKAIVISQLRRLPASRLRVW